MRTFLASAAAAICTLIIYGSSGASAQTQGTQAGITVGETLMLYFPDKAGIRCIVGDLRGNFIRCKDDGPGVEFTRSNVEHWINLQLVAQIDRPVKPQ
jgi:hypothetical protein